MPNPDYLPRGVYRAPCLNPSGQNILYAVDHNHRHLPHDLGGVRYVRSGDNPMTIEDELWDLLDRLDPVSGPVFQIA